MHKVYLQQLWASCCPDFAWEPLLSDEADWALGSMWSSETPVSESLSWTPESGRPRSYTEWSASPSHVREQVTAQVRYYERNNITRAKNDNTNQHEIQRRFYSEMVTPQMVIPQGRFCLFRVRRCIWFSEIKSRFNHDNTTKGWKVTGIKCSATQYPSFLKPSCSWTSRAWRRAGTFLSTSQLQPNYDHKQCSWGWGIASVGGWAHTVTVLSITVKRILFWQHPSQEPHASSFNTAAITLQFVRLSQKHLTFSALYMARCFEPSQEEWCVLKS